MTDATAAAVLISGRIRAGTFHTIAAIAMHHKTTAVTVKIIEANRTFRNCSIASPHRKSSNRLFFLFSAVFFASS